MKIYLLPCFIAVMLFCCLPVFGQSRQDTTALGLAGDNLDLYAVLDLFLKSKTIESFEKSLNEQKSGLNNLDLDLDKKVDFIKIVTKKEDSNSFTFILQVDVSKTEKQDVAVILVNRDKNKKVNVQIVGDEDLYGKDYVIEPKPNGGSSVTANPAYSGPDPVVKDVPASTTVVVQSAPIVQYVYSPAYVPYYPPYYYGYHPPYFFAFTVMAVGIYRHNHWHYHGGYYGGHYGGGNTVIINNKNQINHYNNSRNTSNRVQHNNTNGSYGNGNRGGSRPSNGGASASTRPATGTGSRPSTSTRPQTGTSDRGSGRPSTSDFSSSRSNSANSMAGGRTRNSSGSFGNSSFSGTSRGGGGGRMGGGGGGRRR